MTNFMDDSNSYYSASTEPETANIGTARFVAVLGSGVPGDDAFYAKKAALKIVVQNLNATMSRRGDEFGITPLEWLYWYTDDVGATDIGNVFTKYSLHHLQYRLNASYCLRAFSIIFLPIYQLPLGVGFFLISAVGRVRNGLSPVAP